MAVNKIIIPVSVIIPCYRSAQTIKRAIDSVRMQTCLPAQTILIDDASQDGSLELLRQLQQEYPELNIVIEELKVNSGPGLARNRGWELSDQSWLAFLDADDAWHPQKLQIQWEWIGRHPKVALIGALTKELDPTGRTYLVGDDTQKLVLPNVNKVHQITFAQMLLANRFYTRTVMLQKNLPYRFADRRYTEDYLLWLEIILAGVDACVIPEELAFSFRPEFSGGGYSAQLWKHEVRELNAWHYLYRKKKIILVVLIIAISWSYIKYLRRVIKRAFI
ncbi:glycosyltransferase [Polynucleobacter paneuropaeus]|jgi:glycosyltransferase involved in cell wall biosynthesis|nr:glycosyltransferase [Polynucleobacter paneuropaeus]MBT8571641.1 glycosyltransferase [Polynucleobacter paneuropaeus]MBT8576718.1 glycosyltransferase [Polynucleobacter paneuropaeus]MBT8615111.1 glycosyltransferase [Polynucleobacter paneuropaeus]MBT8616592.1 glycosyltransferase [Polynucleobacter paneuropaeus]